MSVRNYMRAGGWVVGGIASVDLNLLGGGRGGGGEGEGGHSIC